LSQKIRPTGKLVITLRFETYAFNLTCQGYLHVIDKVLFYDDANGSDGALGKAVGVAAGAVALGAALL
jgi:hypothetical protein